ncbi:hypothetical protein WJX72_006078 [[Myrmecia] bisecta]|uniref:Uncharacterized protein n=1 Tax=[Myrmecia] bisecta TaxID=41462 RepID=A0AAW1R764_9CHLO
MPRRCAGVKVQIPKCLVQDVAPVRHSWPCISLHRRSHRRCRHRQLVIFNGWLPGRSAQLQVGVAPAPQVQQPSLKPNAPGTLFLLVFIQAIALVGAFVTGMLARKRRLELEGLNKQLRMINTELRRRRADEDAVVCSTDPEVEALKAYRTALQQSLEAPSAAHPIESYGSDNLSLAQARQTISKKLREGKSSLADGNGSAALAVLQDADELAREVQDVRAQRAVVRAAAKAYVLMGNPQASLDALQQSIELSKELGETQGDADVLGEIADVYADMGDLERAGEYYDKCFLAIQNEAPSTMSQSSWDC